MMVDDLLIRGTHSMSFRPYQWARVFGVCWVVPGPGLEGRGCFVVRYSDGYVDYVAVSDTENYELGPLGAVSFGEP